MGRILRARAPLYQTRGRPVRLVVRVRNPDGSPANLTGASATARLSWLGIERPLDVTTPDASGRLVATGDAALTTTLPLGPMSEVQVSLVRPGGAPLDIVCTVEGEVP